MEFFRRLFDQAAEVWRGMNAGLRTLVVLVALVSAVVLGFLAYRYTQTDYSALARNLPLEEVGPLTARLRERNIPFRLDDGGTTVAVPSDRLATARVEAAGANLSTGTGKGFEVFDESPLGMTPFVQNVNYTRALQSELARSIAQLQPVATARVHIVRPEPTPFVREQKPTTASVVLKLKPNARLDRSSADAIVALVSRAVEGLATENVTVVDTQGRLLTEGRGAEDRIPNSQLEFRRQLEAYLASKAEDILRQHLGSNRAVIRVAADVNFQRVKEKSETFQPEGRVVSAERQQTTKSTGSAGGAHGVAGATSNVTRSAAGASGAAGSPGNTSSTENIQTDYALSKTSRELDNFLNSTNRLTIAAMIDLSELEGKKLTLSDAQDLIKQAIGFREGRDEIKVTDVSLLAAKPAAPAEDDGAAAAQQERLRWVLSAVRTASIVVGLLLLLILGMLMARRMRAPKATEPTPAPPAPVPPAPAPPAPEIDEFRRLAERDPDRVVEILRVLQAS